MRARQMTLVLCFCLGLGLGGSALAKDQATVKDNLERGMALVLGNRLEEARAILEPIAKDGNAKAELVMAVYFSDDSADTKRYWYIRAAKHGDAEAQYEISQWGSLSIKERRGWLEKAAAAGFSQARFALAIMQESEDSECQERSPKSFPQYALTLKSLADRGDFAAQAEMSKLYMIGCSVTRDPVLALMWLDVRSGYPNQSITWDYSDNPKVRRDQLAALLTELQVQQADTLASQVITGKVTAPLER